MQPNFHLLNTFKSISRFSGIAVTAIGGIVLIGWAFNIATFKSISPNLPVMMPNTAICFILSGISLLLLLKTHNDKRELASKISAAVVLLIGVITLLEYIFKINLGIDRLIFREAETPADSYPGRMAPQTAINFTLLGISLLFIDFRFKRLYPSLLSTMLILSLSFLSLIGQVYNVPSLYSISPYTGMALPTAASFIVISIGIFSARPKYGFMAILSSETAGGYIARRLLPVSIILPFILGYLRIVGQRGGFYGTEAGTILLIVSIIVILTSIIIWHAEKLIKSDTERIKTDDSLHHAIRENELLKTIAMEISNTENMHSAIQIVLNKVCESTGWVYGESWIPNKDKNLLEYGVICACDERHTKFLEHSKEFTFKAGIGLPGRVWASGKPEWIRDVSVNGHVFLRTTAAMESGLRAALGVPIIADSKVLAVLIFYMSTASIEDESQVRLISAVASQLGSIIQRKKAEEEKERLQSQISHMQKIETIGQLTGGIAHDFNNLLTAIILSANVLKMKIKDNVEQMYFIQQILSTAERAANLTKSLLTFSRKQVIEKKAVSLNAIIQNAEKLLTRLIGEDIELRINLYEKDIVLTADSGQIEQVLLNLATNARDAMPEGGVLTLDTKAIDIDESFAKTHAFGKTGLHAMITVSDSGMGMDEKTQERIFEPFFTTKGAGKGTGLGLSIVYGIIKAHDGYINVYSEIDRGTTFKIYLPIVKSEVEGAKEQELIPPRGGTETILMAEDEARVRDLAKSVLESYGYKVIEAVDGEDAVKKFDENKDKIQLLITDVVMPKRNGKDVYNEIRKTRPDIKAVFTSGYNEDVIHKKGILEEGLNFISKPFAPTEFLRKVRDALDRQK